MAAPTVDILSGCTGAAGLDLGVTAALELLGFRSRTVCYIEREAGRQASLLARMEQSHLDPAPVWDDITTFDGQPFHGMVDLFVAGIPCQGYSHAGKRRLETDSRNLWPAARRLVREVEPAMFFLENVSGILSKDDRKGKEPPIAYILEDLSEDGYNAAWLSLPALWVGASHRRWRVFVLAYRDGNGLTGSVPCPGAWTRRDDIDGSGQDVAEDQEQSSKPGGMANAECERRREGSRESRVHQRWDSALGPGGKVAAVPLFAPGPFDPRWFDTLLARPDLIPSAQPELLRMVDGLADRVDRVRATGNSCVPLQAAVAFCALWRILP